MRKAASTTKYVSIIDSNGKYVKMELYCCKTIVDIKHNIQSKIGIPVGNQKLIFSGVVLDNHMSLVSYGMLNVVLELLQCCITIKPSNCFLSRENGYDTKKIYEI